MDEIRLTQFSHGAGCGCKLSPAVLDRILSEVRAFPDDDRLLVGNHSRDDACAYDLGDGRAMISTTDFFMPIVDDPFSFGRVAAANAISDIYAMGGQPAVAIGILGWPIDKLGPEVAARVVQGGRALCAEAGIALAGGHSIDSPEPIFGLAVSGLVQIDHLKRNDTAQAGDLLFLTKALGVGILSTAQKRGILKAHHEGVALAQMTELNRVGAALGRLQGVTAMTDVTGFGLLGHLSEMCLGSGVHARINPERVPRIAGVETYLEAGAIPGGTKRNWESYGQHVMEAEPDLLNLFADPQTSGGLLVAVRPDAVAEAQSILRDAGLGKMAAPIAQLSSPVDDGPAIRFSNAAFV